MSVPFGARRETLSQQLTRIEAARSARRDTSGVVAISDPLADFLAGQPSPAFGGLTVSRFLTEHRPDRTASARWSDGAWLAGDPESRPARILKIDCDGEAGRFERLPRDRSRGTSGDGGTLADWPGLNARVEAARIESARRRIERRRLHRILLDDAPLAPGATPDMPDNFEDDIARAVAEAGDLRGFSGVDWHDLPESDQDRSRASAMTLGLVAALAIGLVWLGIHLLSLAGSAA